MEEIAKLWKNEGGGVIVEDGVLLKGILKTVEALMSGGLVNSTTAVKEVRRSDSLVVGDDGLVDLITHDRPGLERQGSSFGISGLHVEGDHEEDQAPGDPAAWLEVISAFKQPRLTFDTDRKHFVQCAAPPSAFPPVSEKASMFRDRYSQIYQRILRNPAFQAPSLSARHNPSIAQESLATTQQHFYRVTPIANLLGRGGTSHLLLGVLAITPTGMLAILDPSASITLDLANATPLQGVDSGYFSPGMIVLVDGVYEESWTGAGSTGLGNTGGVGGMIGGRFLGFGIGSPPVERRDVSLGINLAAGEMGGGFGWTDFLGVGAEKAVGERMRRLETRLLSPESEHACSEARRKTVILGEVNLDDAATLPALRKVLQSYATPDTEPPMTFVLTGNFTSRSALAGTDAGSIEYKTLFDSLAALLADFPSLLRSSTWVFVPGDRDPWASAFSAGASTIIPREGVPDVFTSRLKRAFAAAKADAGPGGRTQQDRDREAIWTSNPTRLSLFGPAHEVVIFRDDISGRFRRTAVRVGAALKVQLDSTQADAASEAAAEQEANEDVTMTGAPADTAEADEVAEAHTSADTSAERTSGDQSFAVTQARKLVVSLLPQACLSPFPPNIRPTHWSYQSSLSLYPLPHCLILVDAEADPFAVTFEGCHVLNPGKMIGDGARRKKVVWAEYDARTKRGLLREDWV